MAASKLHSWLWLEQIAHTLDITSKNNVQNCVIHLGHLVTIFPVDRPHIQLESSISNRGDQ